MTKFTYKIRTAEGKVEEGEIEGKDKYAVAQEFTHSGSTVIRVEEEKKTQLFNMDKINIFLARVKLQDKIVFARNLSAMTSAGLSLSRALGILERQTKNPKFKMVVADLLSEIGKGNSLSESMKKHPKVFSSVFSAMVHAGEESGTLTASLETIGGQLDKSYKLRKKIKGAMMYPSIVISAMIIIGILMMIYVVPTLTATFKDLDAELPASTEFVIFISDLLANNALMVLLVFVIITGAFMVALRRPLGRRGMEFVVLRLPVISKIVRESNSANTARTLSSLLSSGVDMVEALTISRDVVQNSYYKEVFDEAIENVQKGTPLSVAFGNKERLYPLLLGEMIEVGEETGKLADMLLRTAEFYEEEVDNATKDLSTIIEPVLMIVIGSAVGFFAVSMITPMYDVMNNI